MLDRLFTFLQSISGDGNREGFNPGDVRVATVALCNQVMAADGRVTEAEQAIVAQLMRETYGLDDKDIELLREAGERAEKDAVDYFRFTSILNRELTPEQKLELLGVLWDIVYADGIRNEVEDHVIWRVSDLLGVDSKARINSRIEAEKKSRDRLTGDAAEE